MDSKGILTFKDNSEILFKDGTRISFSLRPSNLHLCIRLALHESLRWLQDNIHDYFKDQNL